MTQENNLTSTVAQGLNLTVNTPPGTNINNIFGLALRNNPNRAHLIVSKMLGKHIPVSPTRIVEATQQLGDLIPETLGYPLDESSLVIGYCETATGLGHGVADRLGLPYIHTTRQQHPMLPVEILFEEEHSHATTHLIQPDVDVSLDNNGPIIFVDDEISTGNTILNTIKEIHQKSFHPEYVVATLLDGRTEQQKERFVEETKKIGVPVTVVALHQTQIGVPEGVQQLAQNVKQNLEQPHNYPQPETPNTVEIYDSTWPTDDPTTARHGLTPTMTAALAVSAGNTALTVLQSLDVAGDTLVLGTEELMYAPLLVALELEKHKTGGKVLFQSTTRSPVHASNDKNYAIKRTETFNTPGEEHRVSHIHNITDPENVDGDGTYDDIVVIIDQPAQKCEKLIQKLQPYCTKKIHLVTLPTPHTLKETK